AAPPPVNAEGTQGQGVEAPVQEAASGGKRARRGKKGAAAAPAEVAEAAAAAAAAEVTEVGEAGEAAEQPLLEPPSTGVEIMSTETRGSTKYHTMRDLRNKTTVHNVTRHSARRLWHYAILQHE